MRVMMMGLTLLFPASVLAGELMNGPQIEAVLNDATVWYLPLGQHSARQYFHKNGETPYVDARGEKTYGEWAVRGDEYCSVWPPSDRWTCFAMERGTAPDGQATVIFVSGGNGTRYEGVLKTGRHIDESWQD